MYNVHAELHLLCCSKVRHGCALVDNSSIVDDFRHAWHAVQTAWSARQSIAPFWRQLTVGMYPMLYQPLLLLYHIVRCLPIIDRHVLSTPSMHAYYLEPGQPVRVWSQRESNVPTSSLDEEHNSNAWFDPLHMQGVRGMNVRGLAGGRQLHPGVAENVHELGPQSVGVFEGSFNFLYSQTWTWWCCGARCTFHQ